MDASTASQSSGHAPALPQAKAAPTAAASQAAARTAAPATAAEIQAKQSSQQENLLVLLWLYMNLFTDSYKAVREQAAYPALNQIVEKLCKPYKLIHVAENWGVRQGYLEGKEGSKFLTEHPALLRQFFSDNHGMFWITNHPTNAYSETYHRLRRWILASKQVYQEELRPLLYPVLVHFALELIQYDRGDGVKVAAAHKLVESAKDDHYYRHREQYLALRAICKPEHIQESSVCREFLNDDKPTEANTVHLTPPTYRLLCSYVKEECRRHQLNVLMRIIFLRINVEIKGQSKAPIPDAHDVTPWTADRYYKSVHMPTFPTQASTAAVGVAKGGVQRDGLEPLRFPALWDDVVEQKCSSIERAKAEAAAAAAAAALEASLAEEEAKRKAEELEEAAQQKKKKTKRQMEEERRQKRKEEEEAKKAAKALLVKIPEPPKPPSNLNTTSIPRPKMPDDQVDSLAALYQSRATVDSKVLPSVCFYTIDNTRDGLNTSAVSSDGKLVAAGMQDATVALWDVSKRQPAYQNPAAEHTLRFGETTARYVPGEAEWEASSLWCRPENVMRGHTGAVYATDITQDDRFVATASEDGTVRLWCTFTRSYLLSLRGHNNPVWDVAWSPEGFYVASASYDGTARLWSIDHHYPLRMFVGHAGDVDCVTFHPNCNYLATGGTDRTVRVWDAATGSLIRMLRGHVTGVTSVAFSPDGSRLVSGGEGGELLQWDLGQGRQMSSLVGHKDTVTSIHYSTGQSSLLVSSSVDCTVRLWDASGGGAGAYRDADKPAGGDGEKGAEGGAANDAEAAGARAEGDKGLQASSTLSPVKTLFTKNTPVVAARFGITNLVFAAGAPEGLE